MSDETSDIAAAITATALGEKTITIDGESVTAHDLRSMIAAAKFHDANAGVRTATRGLSVAKLKPPGTV